MSLPVGIDALKSTIGARGGLARANRFAVYMSPPSGPGLLNLDPFSLVTSIANSGFNLSSFINDPRDMFILCESVQFPGRRIMTMEHNLTHKAIKKPYSYVVDEVTFSFLLTGDYFIRKYFDSWQETIIDYNDSKRVGYKHEYAADVIIQQLSTSNDVLPSYQAKLINAYPIAINAVELSNSAENTVLQCSVTLTFDDWESTGISESAVDLIGIGSNLAANTINSII
jgi:hypothetical protein